MAPAWNKTTVKTTRCAGDDDDDDEVVTAAAIARIYKTTAVTIYRWAKFGKIPSIKFEGMVRFNKRQVRARIEGPDREG